MYVLIDGAIAVGTGTVWDLPADTDVKLLEWQGTAPAVADHLDGLLRAIFEVSQTPRTAFGDSGQLLSGVALETEPRPLIQQTLHKRANWTAALRRRSPLMSCRLNGSELTTRSGPVLQA